MTLSWSAPDPVDGAPVLAYRVRWRAHIRQEAYTTDTQVVADLPDGTFTRVEVAAVNSLGAGPYAVRSVTPRRPTGPVRSLAIRAGEGVMSVAWRAPSGQTNRDYQVQWRASGDEYTDSLSADTTDRHYEITGLTGGSTYVVRVRATKGQDIGPWTQISAVAEGFTNRPAAPEGIVAVGSNGLLLVSWSAPSNTNGATIDGYLVQWRADGETYTTENSAETGSSVLNHQISGLTNGTVYTVRVRALTSDGRSGSGRVGDRGAAVGTGRAHRAGDRPSPRPAPGVVATAGERRRSAHREVQGHMEERPGTLSQQ